MPPGMEPGLAVSHVMQVPTGGGLPTPDGRVQMYPCFSFEFHVVLVSIDPEIGKPQIHRYVVGHDCGTVINPDIVRGMTLGGIAHGLGAALLEEFAFDGEGQLLTQSFMDYLLPSAHEVPEVEIVHHVHAVAAHRVRAEGLGRVRLSRRAGRDLQRHQRCGARPRHPLRGAAHPHLRHRRRDCPGQGAAMTRGTAMKLDIGGQERIEAPIERLWASLNDPAFLTRCIPGCRSMREIAPYSYAVHST